MTTLTTDDLKKLHQNFNEYCKKVVYLANDNLGLIAIDEHGEIYAGFREDGYFTVSSSSFSIEQMNEFLEKDKKLETDLRYTEYLRLKEEFEPTPQVNQMIYGKLNFR